MKTSTIILVSVFLFNLNGNAQKTHDSVSRYDIHTMPFTIADPTPRYRIGFEYHTNNPLGYVLDLGYGSSAIFGFTENRNIGDEYSLFELRPELRYYFGAFLSDIYPYVSVELFSIIMKSVSYDDYFHQENSSLVTYFEQATMRKIKSGFHIKTGLKIYATDKLSLDLYGGLGAAIRTIDYLDVINPLDSEHFYWYEWFLPEYRFQGQKIIFHATIGVQFGYYWER